MDEKKMKYNLKTAIQKAKEYDNIKSEIGDLFYSEDEEIGLDIIGEKICSLLGFYG